MQQASSSSGERRQRQRCTCVCDFHVKDRAFQLEVCTNIVAHAARGADRVQMHVLWDAIRATKRRIRPSSANGNRKWVNFGGASRWQGASIVREPRVAGVRVAFRRRKGRVREHAATCLRREQSVRDLICRRRHAFLPRLFSRFARELPHKDSKVLAYHLGLHPGVTYCHPADAKAVPPPFVSRGNDSVMFVCVGIWTGVSVESLRWGCRGADVAAILAAVEQR